MNIKVQKCRIFYVELGKPTVLFKADERTAKLLNMEFIDRCVISSVGIFYKLKDLFKIKNLFVVTEYLLAIFFI